MNQYLALLAAVIVTSSLGIPKIHAKNYNMGQAAQVITTSTNILTSITGKAVQIKSLTSASETPVKIIPLTSVSKTAIHIEPLTSVSKAAIHIEPLTSVSKAAIHIEPLTSVSGAAIDVRTILSQININNTQNKNVITQSEKSKKEPSLKQLKKIKKKKIKYKKMEVPEHNNFKSYMGYKSITCKTSKQYKLQQKAKTGKFGIRTVKGRYLIAMGTYYTKNVGDKFDIKLSDGTIIKCMIGDIKSDRHTDSKRQKQRYDGSIIEFISDPDKMPAAVKRAGSYTACKKLSGSIKEIRKLK